MDQSLDATQDTRLGSRIQTSMLESQSPLLSGAPSPTEELSPSEIPLPTGVSTPEDGLSDYEVSTAVGQDTIVDTVAGSTRISTRKPTVIVIQGYPPTGKGSIAAIVAQEMEKDHHVYLLKENSIITSVDKVNMGRPPDAFTHLARRKETKSYLDSWIETQKMTTKPKAYIIVGTHCVYHDNPEISPLQEAAPPLYSDFARKINATFHPITITCTEADSCKRLPAVRSKTKVSTPEQVKNWRNASYVYDYGETAPNRKTIDTSGTRNAEESAKLVIDHFRDIGVISTEA